MSESILFTYDHVYLYDEDGLIDYGSIKIDAQGVKWSGESVATLHIKYADIDWLALSSEPESNTRPNLLLRLSLSLELQMQNGGSSRSVSEIRLSLFDASHSSSNSGGGDCAIALDLCADLKLMYSVLTNALSSANKQRSAKNGDSVTNINHDNDDDDAGNDDDYEDCYDDDFDDCDDDEAVNNYFCFNDANGTATANWRRRCSEDETANGGGADDVIGCDEMLESRSREEMGWRAIGREVATETHQTANQNGVEIRFESEAQDDERIWANSAPEESNTGGNGDDAIDEEKIMQ